MGIVLGGWEGGELSGLGEEGDAVPGETSARNEENHRVLNGCFDVDPKREYNGPMPRTEGMMRKWGS